MEVSASAASGGGAQAAVCTAAESLPVTGLLDDNIGRVGDGVARRRAVLARLAGVCALYR